MCVLLVEDEPVIREIMAENLIEAGFSVLEAENGDRAVELIGAGPELTALVTDLHMPGNRDGFDVARCARRVRPGIPIVITTGRPDVFERSWHDEFGCMLLRKPYTADRLVSLLRSLLGAAE